MDSNPGTVFMFTLRDSYVIGMCLEGFLYGLYSGIFAIYLQCPSKESKTATIVFYLLCVLYLLSTATLVCDFLNIMQLQFQFPADALSPQLQIDMQTMLYHIQIVQASTIGCCDFISQCILIYRCWIVWGKNIHVVIIPSFLAITFIATWLATNGSITWKLGQFFEVPWGFMMTLTALAASMAVNTLVTGLIVFKILMVFLEVKATSVERTLGSLALSLNAGGPKLRHIIFIIIESGMALFAIQLIRVVLISFWVVQKSVSAANSALNLVIGIHEMLNGITPTIIWVRVSMKLSFDDEESFKEAAGSLHFNNPPPSDPNTLALRRPSASGK